jgi:hypothetical protein
MSRRRLRALLAFAVPCVLLVTAAGAAASHPDGQRLAKTNRVWLSVGGNDANCRRNDPDRPCATFNRAYQVAHTGDVVVVAGGRYPETAPSEGAVYIDPSASKHGVVTFACQGRHDVTFAAPVFAFHPGLSGVTMTGGCFHFHVPYFGYGGYPSVTQNITLDGVHMEGLNCAGCRNVTIKNSEIGPFVACYMPNDGQNAPSYAYCDTSKPSQAFWAAHGGIANIQQEPFVHSGSAGNAINFVLDHDHVHGISSKWDETHTGCLQTWDTDGLRITNSTFDHCAIYDMNISAPSIDDNVMITNNKFGVPVYSFDPTEPRPNGRLPRSFVEGTFGAADVGIDRNWLIRGNTFVNGIRMGDRGSTYRNALVEDNDLGAGSDCRGVGVVYRGNTGSCRGYRSS